MSEMGNYDISIGFILVNSNGNFLVMKKTIDGVWDFPKGHVKPEDTGELTTAIRELNEETQIDVNKIRIINGFRNENTYINPDNIHRKIILFLARCDADPVLSAEHVAYEWAGLEKAKDLLHFKGGQDAITAASEFLHKHDV